MLVDRMPAESRTWARFTLRKWLATPPLRCFCAE
jgi:hypothetical protein